MAKIFAEGKKLARLGRLGADVLNRGFFSMEYDFILVPDHAAEAAVVVAELFREHGVSKPMVRGFNAARKNFPGERALILTGTSPRSPKFEKRMARVAQISAKRGVKIVAVATMGPIPRMVCFPGQGLNGDNPERTLKAILSRFKKK